MDAITLLKNDHKAVEQLFYGTIKSGQLGGMSFAETGAALRSTAMQMWGTDSANTAIVNEELQAAGI